MVIEPGRIINDFIEPNKRQYAIPVYQRNYEWSKEQCIKLFSDIVQAYKKDKSHFCGSVVYALMKEEHNIHYYIIIDGQQRLTTIYILLKALLDHADTESAKALIEEALFNIDKFDTYDVDTASNLSTTWQQMLGENWQADRDRYLHTLGNLTLTGYNSELGDKPFAEKKELLSEVHTKVVKLYETIKCCNEWNATTIEARADVLSKKITRLYAVESPQVIVDFSDPRYKEYSCTTPDDATYKTPNYYILQGERVSVNNYAEMLRSVISRLYAIDSTIIENMARNDEQPVSWSQNVMFSYDSAKTTGDYQIKGTSIYESVGFSAYHIMCIIRALLIKYDIEATEFVYSARSNRSADESTSGGSNE